MVPEQSAGHFQGVSGHFLVWVLEGLLWWFLGSFRAAPAMRSPNLASCWV